MGSLEKIAVRELIKRFDRTVVLRGVSFEADPGTAMVVEGANGSGKSTLLGILAGLVRPDSGTVEFVPWQGIPRGRIGLVSHETLCYGELSGRENVELAARLNGLEVGTAWGDAKRRFELGEFAERRVRTNSRGQRQRVALARALVQRPAVVLLDEPTTGLDQKGVGRLLEVLAEEVARGAFALVVTHEPQLFASLKPRRLLLERGRIEERFT